LHLSFVLIIVVVGSVRKWLLSHGTNLGAIVHDLQENAAFADVQYPEGLLKWLYVDLGDACRIGGETMRALGVRYRVRVRFTVWRLMSAVVCFGLALGVRHDAEYTDWEAGETPWVILA
jgi:hypothetical protein